MRLNNKKVSNEEKMNEFNKTFSQKIYKKEDNKKIASSRKNSKDNKLIKNKEKFDNFLTLENEKCTKKNCACKRTMTGINIGKDKDKSHKPIISFEKKENFGSQDINKNKKQENNKVKGKKYISNNKNELKEKRIAKPIEIEFNYNGTKVVIQSNLEEKMQNIINNYFEKENFTNTNLFFVYNGTKINTNLSLNKIINDIDIERKKLNILVIDTTEDIQNEEIISKDFVCPECYESILINLGDYKLNYICKNKHSKKQIPLKDFNELLKVDLKKIICGQCKENTKYSSYQNEFYFCLTCKLNICPLCKPNHSKEHKIVNYNDKNYICGIHNEKFNKYCESCEQNVCFYCELEHKGHKNLVNLQSMIIDKEKIKNEINETGKLIELIKQYIDDMKNKLDETLKTIEIFYNTNKIFIENYDIMKRNYQILKNLDEIKRYNSILLKDFKYLKNTGESFSNKISHLIDIYNAINANNIEIIYPNGDKYIGEYKNNMRNGKGKIYYNQKNENNRYSYEGDWKDDLFDGKGILKYNNNDVHIGEWKSGIMEGKGTLILNNGDVYKGDIKNGMKEGKGIYTYSNLNRYEGEMKNNYFDGEGIFYSNNGDKYIGEFKVNQAEGKGVIFRKNGEMEMGVFIKGNISGKYAFLDLNNKITIKKS